MLLKHCLTIGSYQTVLPDGLTSWSDLLPTYRKRTSLTVNNQLRYYNCIKFNVYFYSWLKVSQFYKFVPQNFLLIFNKSAMVVN